MIIRNIENDNGKKTDTNGILNSFRSFYEQLFTKEAVEETLNVISFENLPQVDDNDKIHLDLTITKEEVFLTLKSMNPNKSPGSDGLTAAFH